MVIPEPLLLALTELFLGNRKHASPSPLFQIEGYRIDTLRWSCLLADSPKERWFFRPIGPNPANSMPHLPELETAREPWVIDSQLSEEIRKSIQSSSIAPILEKNLCRLCVLSSPRFGAVLSASCTDLQLVATTLQTWGNPPESVIRDWQNQLDSVPKSSPLPYTAETLVTEDGTLIPLSNLLEQFDGTRLKMCPVPEEKSSIPAPFSCPSPDWPKWDAKFNSTNVSPESSQKVMARSESSSEKDFESGFDFISNRPLNVHPKIHFTAPNKSSHYRKSSKKIISKLFVAGIVVAAITSLASSFWLLNLGSQPKSEQPDTDDKQTSAFASTDSPRRSLSTHQEASLGSEPNESALAANVVTSDPIDTFTHAFTIPSEMTVDSLLAQLRPNQESPISLNSLTASSVISKALSPTETELPTGLQGDATLVDGHMADADELPDLNPILTEHGIISLERPLKLQAAKGKETVAVGAFVLTKACRCEIELKLGENVVVEPMEVVTIEGIGKASWKIAIEDEDPELMVEIESKPGARWQLISSVWLREVRGAVPILIGPRQAQHVGNRLIDYRQWINASVEALRNARSNSHGRSNIDFQGEIKKLERQEREAEKAIDRWKVIARLSHYFFDSNEMRIQMTAVEKPSLK